MGHWPPARQFLLLRADIKAQKNERLQPSLAGGLNKEQTAGDSRLGLSACQQPGAREGRLRPPHLIAIPFQPGSS